MYNYGIEVWAEPNQMLLQQERFEGKTSQFLTPKHSLKLQKLFCLAESICRCIIARIDEVLHNCAYAHEIYY